MAILAMVNLVLLLVNFWYVHRRPAGTAQDDPQKQSFGPTH